MRMTDEEIRREFEEAADQKKQVKILAEENGVGIWEMREHLCALGVKGLDLRWFSGLDPARERPKPKPKEEKTAPKPEKPAGEKVEYLKKIIKEQDKQLKSTAAEREELKKKIEELTSELAEKSDRLDAAEKKLFGLAGALQAERAEKEKLTRELNETRSWAEVDAVAFKSQIKDLQKKLEESQTACAAAQEDYQRMKEAYDNAYNGLTQGVRYQQEAREVCEMQREMIRKKDAEIADLRARQGINATSRLGLIRWFCRDLTGPAAYLMGRIVEHLLDWRETGSAEELRKFWETMTEDENEN